MVFIIILTLASCIIQYQSLKIKKSCVKEAVLKNEVVKPTVEVAVKKDTVKNVELNQVKKSM